MLRILSVIWKVSFLKRRFHCTVTVYVYMYMYRMMYNVLVMLMHPVPPVCISATHRCGAVVAVDLEVEQLWKEVLLFTAGLLPAKPGGGDTGFNAHIFCIHCNPSGTSE